MPDHGPHSAECAAADGGVCHCDCHGAMHGITHAGGKGKHGAHVSITKRARGGGVEVVDTRTGVPPGGGTKAERIERRAGDVKVTARGGQVAKSADLARWKADAAKPGTKLTGGETRRAGRTRDFERELAEAVATRDRAVRDAGNAAEAKARAARLGDRAAKKRRQEAEATTRAAHDTDVRMAENALEHVRTTKEAWADEMVGQRRERAQKADPDRPLAVYGDLLNVEDESDTAHLHLSELETVPVAFHAAFADHAANAPGKPGGVFIGDKATPDLDELGYLRDEQPRGWHAGATFREVAGLYSPVGHKVAIGGGGHGHGSTSLALHEFGHAADAATGAKLGTGGVASDAPEYVALHDRIRQTIGVNPYYVQEDHAGRSEAWAEGFAGWSKGRDGGRDAQAAGVAKALSVDEGLAGDLADYYAGVQARIEA